MKKRLVTGAGGFIGSHLVEELVGHGHAVKALVHYNSRNSWGWLEGSPVLEKIDVVAGDIRDADIVRHAMKGCDTVFHLAALIGIPYSYVSPEAYLETNIKGSLNVFQAARDFGVRKIVHTSTSEVYGTAQFVPIDERHPINPQSPYAASKSAADFLALSFFRSFDFPVTVVRPFNTYGPRQSARAIVPTIITQIASGEKKIKLGSLDPRRDLTFVKDTVNGFMLAGQSDKGAGAIINLGNNTEISIRELALLIARIMGAKITIENDAQRKRPSKSEVDRLWADNSQALNILKWKPKHSLEDGLKKTIAWFKQGQNLKKYKAGIYNV